MSQKDKEKNDCHNCNDCNCGYENNEHEREERYNIKDENNQKHLSEHEETLKQHEELKKQYLDIKDTLQRVYAEFQNYKKRTDEDRQNFIKLSNEDLIKKILPIIDNLELSLEHKKCDDEFSKGIELIYAQFIQILEDEGVRKILSSGKFDPKLHEILMTEESSKEEGVILEEFQKGYTLGGKVLRHAKVKISKNQKKNSA